MNITIIIDWLNKNLGYSLDSRYYAHIAVWTDWWRGYYQPFHRYRQVNPDGSVTDRKLYTLRMAKKVCRDWASILLNEKTRIVIDDKASADFLVGSDGSGGEFGRLNFWDSGNKLIEKAFYSGTGAFLVRAKGMAVTEEGEVVPDRKTALALDYLDAQRIIPLSVRGGVVTEAAFVSEETRRGKSYVYLELHELEDSGTYRITNLYFRINNDTLIPEPLSSGVAPVWHTGSRYPLFALISPNEVNNIECSNGLGASIFSDAIDDLQGVDLAFNNFCRDFYLGGKKVFYNKSLVHQAKDRDGNVVTIAPDDVAQQLFMQMGDAEDFDDVKSLVYEFNPALRVAENKDGIQAALDYLSFKVGLGTKHYQFNAGSVVTATQYTGDKQELVQNAAKHYITVEAAIKTVVQAALWIGKEVVGLTVDPEAVVTVQFEDSYIIDKESERLRDQQEVRDGLMLKWEYRMKWYGEDEATAKKMVGENRTDGEWMGFGGDS
ncbi:MAG: hypothetical protein DBX91_05235 [Subdoligranulum variabile]|nr:MAG: hypothetical protein DBX91_05235 [Subdoligranulum variabile]